MLAKIQKLPLPQKSSFIYRLKSNQGFRFNWHFHPEYELTLIVRSHGRRFVGDNISDYRDGDLVLLGPNLPHTWQSFPDSTKPARHRACVIQFQETFLGDGFFDSVELRQVKSMLRRSAQGLCFQGRARDQAAKQIEKLGKLNELQRLTSLIEILGLLSRSRKTTLLSTAGFAPSLHRLNHQRIDRVCNYINDNYLHQISLPEVANLVQMSPSALSNFFKKTVGQTFIEYINNLRISHACRLLIETDRSILNICHQSGFNNLSNFNRRFLSSKGVSPRAYRSAYLSGESID